MDGGGTTNHTLSIRRCSYGQFSNYGRFGSNYEEVYIYGRLEKFLRGLPLERKKEMKDDGAILWETLLGIMDVLPFEEERVPYSGQPIYRKAALLYVLLSDPSIGQVSRDLVNSIETDASNPSIREHTTDIIMKAECECYDIAFNTTIDAIDIYALIADLIKHALYKDCLLYTSPSPRDS